MVSYAIADDTLRCELARELGLGREVQVRVEDEPLAEVGELRRQRLLHLDDHARRPTPRRRRPRWSRPLRVVLVADAAALAGALLDEHRVTALRSCARRRASSPRGTRGS